MPDRLPFPIPFFGQPGPEGPQYPGIDELLRQLDEKRRERGAPPIVNPDQIPDEQALPGIPVEDARETGGSGSDSVFDLDRDTGVIMPGSETPVPLPDPGSVDWSQYRVIYPGDGPVLYDKKRGRIGRLIPRAFEGRRAPVPPALLQLQRRPSRPSGARARERSRPRGLQGFPSALLGVHLPGALRIPLPSRQRTSSAVPKRLAFRGPRTTVPRPLETETTPGGFEIPYPYPQKIGKPRDRDERARARVLLDKIHRGESIVPLPDVNPNAPPPSRRRTFPPSTPAPSPSLPLPSPSPAPSIPAPRIPAPGPVTLPNPLPLPAPPVPQIPPPRPRGTPPKTAPRRFKPAIRTAQGLGIASILRPILRRKTGESQSISSLLQRFTAPFDPVLQPIGEVLQPIAQPIAQPSNPVLENPLTPANALALSLNPQATGTRRPQRKKDCECEETEEEKEARRRPSSKVATVKTFRRRMSQNSLDNLKG